MTILKGLFLIQFFVLFSAMQTANKNLMDTLSEIYEKEWVGQDMLYVQVKNGI